MGTHQTNWNSGNWNLSCGRTVLAVGVLVLVWVETDTHFYTILAQTAEENILRVTVWTENMHKTCTEHVQNTTCLPTHHCMDVNSGTTSLSSHCRTSQGWKRVLAGTQSSANDMCIAKTEKDITANTALPTYYSILSYFNSRYLLNNMGDNFAQWLTA